MTRSLPLSSLDVPMTTTLVLALLLLPVSQAFSLATNRGGMTMDLEIPNMREGSPFLRTATTKTSSWGGWKPSPSIFRRNEAARLDDNQRSVRQAETSHGMPWRSSIEPTYQGNGPYYMAFWEYQMDFMKEHLTNPRAIPTLSSTGQDMSYVENSDDNVRMHTIQFQSDEYDLIRMTLLDGGNKTQVFLAKLHVVTLQNGDEIVCFLVGQAFETRIPAFCFFLKQTHSWLELLLLLLRHLVAMRENVCGEAFNGRETQRHETLLLLLRGNVPVVFTVVLEVSWLRVCIIVLSRGDV